MDLKYLKDADEQNHVALSVVDGATSWRARTLLKTWQSSYVARKVLELWVVHYGLPETFVVDQGGEFEADFFAMCEDHGLDTNITGSHAPWQHGFAERHGAILGTIRAKVVHKHGIKRKACGQR